MGGMVLGVCGSFCGCPRYGICIDAPTMVPKLNASNKFSVILRTHNSTACRSLGYTASALLHVTSRQGRFAKLSTSLRRSIPRFCFGISHSGAQLLNIPVSSMFSAVGTFANSMCIGSFGVCGHICHICVRTRTSCHTCGSGVGLFFIHDGSGSVVPMATLNASRCAANSKAVGQFGVFGTMAVGNRTSPKCDSNRTVGLLRRVTHGRLPRGVKVS